MSSKYCLKRCRLKVVLLLCFHIPLYFQLFPRELSYLFSVFHIFFYLKEGRKHAIQNFIFEHLQLNLYLWGIPIQVTDPFDLMGWGCYLATVIFFTSRLLLYWSNSHLVFLRAGHLAIGIYSHLFYTTCFYLCLFCFNQSIKTIFEYVFPVLWFCFLFCLFISV